MAAHPELAVEQDVLDRAYARATDPAGEPLIFGRIDQDGESRYVGRCDVVDDDQMPLVVAWHSRYATPFYAADPSTVTLKRQFVERAGRLTALHDEIVDGDDRTGAAAREQMERRADTMRAATATLTAQQYNAIVADPATPVVISGGPGTGKTQAGLHRAAWLAHRHPEIRAAGIAYVAPSGPLRSRVAAVLSALDADDVIVTDSVDTAYGHIVVDEAHRLSPDELATLADRSASLTLLGDLPPPAAPGATLPSAHHVTLTTSFRLPNPVADLLSRQPTGTPVTSVRDGIGRPLIRPTDAAELTTDAVRAASAAASTGFHVAVVVPPGRLDATRRLADSGQCVTVAAPAELVGLEFDAVAVVAPDEIVAESGRTALHLALSRCTQSLAIFHAEPLPTGLDHLRPPDPSRLPQL
ncbi:hypothetical protein [Haloactinopolyspora sp.]|uniref:hypothetical protein n=1 Tax=Haloactinopolyspora sp. TaxID=1966353 RepID=UPI00262B4E3F|nr:hypothetical protein [Haloactinopolyspora sp.]